MNFGIFTMVPTEGAGSPKVKQYAVGKMDWQISKFHNVFGGQLTCVNNAFSKGGCALCLLLVPPCDQHM